MFHPTIYCQWLIKHRRQKNSDSGNPVNGLAEAIAVIASQQQISQASSALFKRTTTNTLTFEGKNEKIDFSESLFQFMLKKPPETSEPMKIFQFHSHFRKEDLKTFTNKHSSNKGTLKDVLIVF